MTVSVLVPLSDSIEREIVWRWLRRRWTDQLGEWDIVVGTAPCGEQWSKGRAVNSAYERSTGDVVVIADADSWVNAGVMRTALSAVEQGTPWVAPHDHVFRLSMRTTSLVLGGVHPELEDVPMAKPWPAPAGGGMVVLPRTAMETVNGFDDRFTGWGGDDIAFGWALDTLVGGHACLGARLYHLWHPPHPQRRRSPNDRLAGRYAEANGHPELMSDLVRGVPDDNRWRERVAVLRDAAL